MRKKIPLKPRKTKPIEKIYKTYFVNGQEIKISLAKMAWDNEKELQQ